MGVSCSQNLFPFSSDWIILEKPWNQTIALQKVSCDFFFLKNTFSLICIFLCSASVFPFFPYFPSFVISFEGFPVVMGSKMAMPPPFHQELALHLEWFHVALSLSHTPFIATNPWYALQNWNHWDFFFSWTIERLPKHSYACCKGKVKYLAVSMRATKIKNEIK